MFSESHSRSIAKAITWRVLGSIATTLIVFVFTRRLIASLAVGGVEFLSKIGLFWLHERIWDRIPLGRHTEPRSAFLIDTTGVTGAKGERHVTANDEALAEKRTAS
jgi:adenylylsulfate kinase